MTYKSQNKKYNQILIGMILGWIFTFLVLPFAVSRLTEKERVEVFMIIFHLILIKPLDLPATANIANSIGDDIILGKDLDS